MVKKILVLTLASMMLTANNLPASFKNKQISLKRSSKVENANKRRNSDELISLFLESINNFQTLSSDDGKTAVFSTPSQTAKYDKDKFYKMFPCYNEGGEYISPKQYDKEGKIIQTIPRDISLRYYDGEGMVNCDFAANYDIDTFDGLIGGRDYKPVSIFPPIGVYFKNNDNISPCVTSATLSIIKSISITNNLERPDTITDNTIPYILNKRVGKKSTIPGKFDLTDPFYYNYTTQSKDFMDKHFSTKKYNGVTLLEEKSTDYLENTNYEDFAYTYNEYAKLGSVVGWGGDSIIPGIAKYLEENALSKNGKHRFTLEGERNIVNSSMDSYYKLCKYLVNNPSGTIGGDDDYLYPDYPKDYTPGGHAFVIVGYGVTQKTSATDNVRYNIPEIIYCVESGLYAAIPAMDLCDWFDLTIKQQNKEWFGWRTSTDSKKWYK